MREKTFITKRWLGFLVLAAAFLAFLIPSRADASTIWESEGNDVPGSANAIALNQLAKGSLGNAKEEDWYKLDINQDGYFTISLGPDSTTKSEDIEDGWQFEIQDSNRNTMKSYTRIKTLFTSKSLAFQQGTYYIRVRAQNNDTFFSIEAPVNCTYNLYTNFTPDSSWDLDRYYGYESLATAKQIEAGKTYTGSLYTGDDVDCFYLNSSSKGKMNVGFTIDSFVPSDDIKNGWKLKILDKNRNELYKAEDIKTSFTTDLVDFDGPVYIQIESDWSYDSNTPIDCPYHITVNQYPTNEQKPQVSVKVSKTSLKKIKNLKGRKALVRWKRKKNVQGYQIQYSMKKSFKKARTRKIWGNATVKCTLKNLKKGTWYVRIRTFKGSKYSAWSKKTKIVIRK